MTRISQELVHVIFETSLVRFLKREANNTSIDANECKNCSRLSEYLEQAAHERGLTAYTADCERKRKLDRTRAMILDDHDKDLRIDCDLVLHARGVNVAEDNLIAIELKKKDRPEAEKQRDRQHLRALTAPRYRGARVSAGTQARKFACSYRLGAFIELDRHYRVCTVETFQEGALSARSQYRL